MMIKNPYPGRFITIEGIDGSGKSDQFKLIRNDLLAAPNINVVFTKEPPNNEVGVEIYDILRKNHPTIKLSDLSRLEMQRKYFLARRMQYQDLNIPVLRAGVHVVSDRGVLSVAYGLKDITELDHFSSIQQGMFDYHRVPLITPDLNLIYDVDIDVAIERLKKKNRALDEFEQKSILEPTRTNYLAIAQKIPNCIVIDGMPPIEEVFKETKKHIYNLLGLKI